jgi:protein arginine kinase activator
MKPKSGSGPDGDDKGVESSANRKCPVCGLDTKAFRSTGRLGCPLDYDTFAAELAPVFRSSQAASLHVGKWPKRGPSHFDVLKLNVELRQAIERQDYEKAALIRDRLRDRNKPRDI